MLPALALAQAQGAQVPFGGLSHDSTLPVEITSDRLDLDQAAGTAVFTGTVKVGPGRAPAGGGPGGGVLRRRAGGRAPARCSGMVATGNVTLANGSEAAEADSATYEVAAGTIVMQGDVLLTQGQNALSSETLNIDLNAGTGRLEGRVKTIFMPQSQDGTGGGGRPRP